MASGMPSGQRPVLDIVEAPVTAASQRILANFSRFDAEVRLAETAYANDELEMAAFYAATASTIATHNHCGIFASPRLETILNAAGRRITSQQPKQTPRDARDIKNVLHVGSELSAVGGLTRMISRWINADAKRVNSLVLTQNRGTIPQHLTDAVTRSGGNITNLNQTIGTRFDWVRKLRQMACDHELIVLHIHCEDVIPVLAFADATGLPPVLLLNHADHLFWLGTSVADLTLNLRDAATDISVQRRGIEPSRNYLLPTIVDAAKRTRSRSEAKSELGLKPDEIMLLSVARRPKYRTLDGVSFADRHVRLLKKHPKARLIVVGSGEYHDWKLAREQVGGRIIGLSEVPDPKLYFEAADIYVDSYPFVSSTSMMEAAGYGLPLVTIFTLPEQARIFGINHVGLVGTSLVATSAEEYEALLERLVTDPDYRQEKGEAARQAIERCHAPSGWHTYLEVAFKRALDLPSRPDHFVGGDGGIERPNFGPPDDLHQDIVGSNYAAAEINMVYMGALPLRQRLKLWARMHRRGEIAGLASSFRLLWPEWLKRTLKP